MMEEPYPVEPSPVEPFRSAPLRLRPAGSSPGVSGEGTNPTNGKGVENLTTYAFVYRTSYQKPIPINGVCCWEMR